MIGRIRALMGHWRAAAARAREASRTQLPSGAWEARGYAAACDGCATELERLLAAAPPPVLRLPAPAAPDRAALLAQIRDAAGGAVVVLDAGVEGPTPGTADPTCPACGKTAPDWGDVVSRDVYDTADRDGDAHAIFCPHCSTRYRFTVHVRQTYTSEPVESP